MLDRNGLQALREEPEESRVSTLETNRNKLAKISLTINKKTFQITAVAKMF